MAGPTAVIPPQNAATLVLFREELLRNKEGLLPNGDRWKSLLVKRLKLDASCRWNGATPRNAAS